MRALRLSTIANGRPRWSPLASTQRAASRASIDRASARKSAAATADAGAAGTDQEHSNAQAARSSRLRIDIENLPGPAARRGAHRIGRSKRPSREIVEEARPVRTHRADQLREVFTSA